MKTEYVIGQVVNLPWIVKSITIYEGGTRYKLASDATEITLSLTEGQITDIDCISADSHEAEIADLKDEISRLREMYQLGVWIHTILTPTYTQMIGGCHDM